MTPVEREPSKPTNMEVLIEEDHDKDTLDTLQIVKRVRIMSLDGMKNGTTYDDLYGTLQQIAKEI